MKLLQIGHAILTVVLLTGVSVFAVLVLSGVIEVRVRSGGATTEPSRSVEISGAKARLLVVRGLRPNWEYRIFEGRNILGRADDKPVDIDLQPQEPEDRVWSSRQHAAITCEGSTLLIEDLGSANGTYVNRSRVPPGEKRPLRDGDIIQIGEVQIKVLL
jgi:hypothetical protein